jgi:hypothetical protein
MRTKDKELIYDGPEVARCRRVRHELFKEFKTLDAWFDELVRLDRIHRQRLRRRKARKKALAAKRSRS